MFNADQRRQLLGACGAFFMPVIKVSIAMSCENGGITGEIIALALGEFVHPFFCALSISFLVLEVCFDGKWSITECFFVVFVVAYCMIIISDPL